MDTVIKKFVEKKYNYKINSAMFNRRYKQTKNIIENYKITFNAYDKSTIFIINRIFPVVKQNNNLMIYF